MLKKSIRNGLIGFALLSGFSFLYGGIYNEMIMQGAGITVENILYALLGAVFLGALIAFLPVFIISLIVYYLKGEK